MFKNIFKRLGLQVLIYLLVFYLIPYISINFLPEALRDMVTALFLVVFNLLIIIVLSSIDTYKYKLNWLFWIIPGLLFIPSIHLFYSMDLLIYALLYSGSYGVGMLLGWSYRTYGYQLKPGYKKIYNEEKRKALELKKQSEENEKKDNNEIKNEIKENKQALKNTKSKASNFKKNVNKSKKKK